MEYNYKVKHSRFGIASLVIFLTYFVIAILTTSSDIITLIIGYRIPMFFSVEPLLLTGIMVLMNIIGTILGLIGVIRYGTKKVFAYLGLILNGLIIILILSAIFRSN